MVESIIQIFEGVSSGKDSFLYGLSFDRSIQPVVAEILDDAKDGGDGVGQLLPFLHADVPLTLKHDFLAL